MAVEAWEVVGRYSRLVKAMAVLEKLREGNPEEHYRMMVDRENLYKPWMVMRKIK